MSVLDVTQIFGRAGRPQYDSSGVGVIICAHDKLSKYVGLLTHQTPIESQLLNGLVDALNAEVCLGTVTNIDEASRWLRYTFLYVRMLKNPLVYGIAPCELEVCSLTFSFTCSFTLLSFSLFTSSVCDLG